MPTADYRYHLTIFDTTTGKEIKSGLAVESGGCVVATGDGRYFLATFANALYQIDAQTGEIMATWPGLPPTCGNAHATAGLVATVHERDLWVWRLADGVIFGQVAVDTPLTAVPLAPDRKRVAVGSEQGGVQVFDLVSTTPGSHRDQDHPADDDRAAGDLGHRG